MIRMIGAIGLLGLLATVEPAKPAAAPPVTVCINLSMLVNGVTQEYCQPVDATHPLPVTAGSAGTPPYQYTALAGGQYNQAATTAQGLTVPTGAGFARVCAVTAQMNFSDAPGVTPTTGLAPTAGTPLGANSCIWLAGASTLSAFKVINAVASTGVWSAEYYQ